MGISERQFAEYNLFPRLTFNGIFHDGLSNSMRLQIFQFAHSTLPKTFNFTSTKLQKYEIRYEKLMRAIASPSI